jgi:hypothetical protein
MICEVNEKLTLGGRAAFKDWLCHDLRRRITLPQGGSRGTSGEGEIHRARYVKPSRPATRSLGDAVRAKGASLIAGTFATFVHGLGRQM